MAERTCAACECNLDAGAVQVKIGARRVETSEPAAVRCHAGSDLAVADTEGIERRWTT